MANSVHQIYDAEVAVGVNAAGYNAGAKKVIASTKNLTQRLKLRANINQPVRALGKLNNHVKSTTRSILSTLGGLVAVGGLTSFLKQSVEVGRNLNAMRSLSKQVFPSMTEDMEKWAQAAGQTYALSERMALKYASQLGAMAEAMGFSEKEAYNMSTTLTQLAGDVASFYSISQDEAYTKLRSVFSGESEPLKDLGVVMTQTNLDAYALANGFNKTTKDMNQTELAALRYQFVLNSLSKAQGDVQRTSQSFGVQLRFLKLGWENFMATIGQGIINILLPLMKVLNQIIARLQAVANAFKAWTERFKPAASAGSKLTKGLAGVGDTSASAAESTDALGSSLDETGDSAKGAAKKLKQAQRDIMGFDQINKLTEKQQSEGTSGSSGTSGGVPSVGIDEITPSDEAVAAAAQGFAAKFIEAAKNAKDWTLFGATIAGKIATALGKIPWDTIQAKVKEVAEKIASFLNGFLGSESLWSATGKTIAEAINTAIIGAKSFFEKLEWGQIGKAIASGFNDFISNLKVKEAAEAVSSLATGVLSFFSSAIKNIKWGNVGKAVVEFLANVDWVGIINGSLDLAGSLVEGFFELVTGAFDKAIEKATEEKTFEEALEPVKQVGKGALVFVIRIKLAWDKMVKSGAKNILRMLGFDIPDAADLDLSGVSEAALQAVESAGLSEALTIKLNLKDGEIDPKASEIVGLKGGTTERTLKQGLVKSGNYLADVLNVTKLDGGTVFRTIAQSVKKGGTWFAGAVTMAGKKGGTTSRTLSQSVKRGGYWSSSAADMADKKKGTIGRTVSQSVKRGSWSDSAYTAGGWPADTITRNVKVTTTFANKAAKIAYTAFALKYQELAKGGIMKGGRWQPVTAAASGGSFNQGQMFVAREAGPELVGTIGGNSAVMNNDQIVASVSAGVYKAVVAAMDNDSRSVPVYLMGDAATFFRVMQKEAQSYTNATGMAAFPA